MQLLGTCPHRSAEVRRKSASSSLTPRTPPIRFGPESFNYDPEDRRLAVFRWYIMPPASCVGRWRCAPPSESAGRTSPHLATVAPLLPPRGLWQRGVGRRCPASGRPGQGCTRRARPRRRSLAGQAASGGRAARPGIAHAAVCTLAVANPRAAATGPGCAHQPLGKKPTGQQGPLMGKVARTHLPVSTSGGKRATAMRQKQKKINSGGDSNRRNAELEAVRRTGRTVQRHHRLQRASATSETKWSVAISSFSLPSVPAASARGSWLNGYPTSAQRCSEGSATIALETEQAASSRQLLGGASLMRRVGIPAERRDGVCDHLKRP